MTVDATGSASFKKDTLKFPITGGKATPPSYDVTLGGGIKLTSGSHSVKISNIDINSDGNAGTGTATADIGKAKSASFLTFSTPDGGSGGPGEVQFAYDTVKLTKSASKKLDKALSTKFFAKNETVGAAFFDITFKS